MNKLITTTCRPTRNLHSQTGWEYAAKKNMFKHKPKQGISWKWHKQTLYKLSLNSMYLSLSNSTYYTIHTTYIRNVEWIMTACAYFFFFPFFISFCAIGQCFKLLWKEMCVWCVCFLYDFKFVFAEVDFDFFVFQVFFRWFHFIQTQIAVRNRDSTNCIVEVDFHVSHHYYQYKYCWPKERWIAFDSIHGLIETIFFISINFYWVEGTSINSSVSVFSLDLQSIKSLSQAKNSSQNGF